LQVVQSDMALLMVYAEVQANANPEEGEAIIEGAGFYVVKRVIVPKPDLAVKYGLVTSQARICAKAKKGRNAYHCQITTTQTTWNHAPSPVYASTSVSGLTPALIYYFRYRTLSADGLSEWSAPVSFIAH